MEQDIRSRQIEPDKVGAAPAPDHSGKGAEEFRRSMQDKVLCRSGLSHTGICRSLL